MSDCSWPHGLQQARPLYPPLFPRVCSNSCPLSRCCYLIISSSPAPSPFAYHLSHSRMGLYWLVSVDSKTSGILEANCWSAGILKSTMMWVLSREIWKCCKSRLVWLLRELTEKHLPAFNCLTSIINDICTKLNDSEKYLLFFSYMGISSKAICVTIILKTEKKKLEYEPCSIFWVVRLKASILFTFT